MNRASLDYAEALPPMVLRMDTKIRGGVSIGSPREVLSFRMAALSCGAVRRSARVVLAIPGGHRDPFERGIVADIARRAALAADFLSPTAKVEPWLYTDTAHRLPDLEPRRLDRWVADWGVLPRTRLLPSDAEPDNLLMRHAAEYRLFGEQSVARAMRAIAQEARASGVPTFVLFFTYVHQGEKRPIAQQLEAASDSRVFWQFFEEDNSTPDLRSLLRELRTEAPHITNADWYDGWYYSVQGTFNLWFYRGILNPFAQWRRRG